MRSKKLDSYLLAGVIALGLAGWLTLGAVACQKKGTESAQASPETSAGETVTTETTTTTTTVTEGEPVTADPVIVSQRNAKVRRARRSPASTTDTAQAVGATPRERSGYSEERPAPASTFVVPEGTILRVAFKEPISTATAQVGQTVKGELLDDMVAEDGTVVARSGATVTGKVEHVVSSGKLARPAELRFRLTEVETRYGTVPVSTSAYERTGKTHTQRNVGYIAGGAAVGAILGQVLGGDTESTLKGAAAGAAAGTGVAAATGDLDFEIEPGRTVAFTLEEPLNVRR